MFQEDLLENVMTVNRLSKACDYYFTISNRLSEDKKKVKLRHLEQAYLECQYTFDVFQRKYLRNGPLTDDMARILSEALEQIQIYLNHRILPILANRNSTCDTKINALSPHVKELIHYCSVYHILCQQRKREDCLCNYGRHY